ncbi:Signal recognition particle protein [Coemansia sp. RSA 2706]|nr:Signal recognition particle protein [Coemansia sp. RSA 2706]KAJ2314342.1 Signal recognition particle protein [Coemansia sp. RSA 2704]KAJ2724977.1 Signal recognition particle protein [Coemansia sp. Cherry 401B]
MVYYSDWDTFERAASELFASAADRARYTIKYRNCDAALVLKVTDDATCVQIRTERLDDIKRIARLHRQLCLSASHRTEAIKALPPKYSQATKPEAPAASTKVSKSSGAVSKSAKKKPRGKKR